MRPHADSILDAIGNTPIVKLRRLVPQDWADVYVKLEGGNPTGSYKDRMALAMVEGAEKRGDLRPGTTVVEYTGGSTGSSLAFVCAAKGYHFQVVSSDAFAVEKLKTMQAFGADLVILPSPQGITPELIPRMMAEAERLAASPNTFATDQMNNRDALDGYEVLGRELVEQLAARIDVFCAGVGTGGLLMGVARALRAAGMGTRVVALEPAGSPLLTTGRAGTHHVEGIGVGFVPPHLSEGDYEAMAIDENEARQVARRLAREEGILAGVSSGLNVAGALRTAQALGRGHTVATVAVDTGLKYLSGGLFDE
jgi:cysteine synthase A